mgnify:CR=1 FL=1
MAGKNTAVFGIYSSVEQAERAVDALIRDGFSDVDVSVLLPDHQGSRDFAHEKHTKAPEGTTTGVAAGGTIGGTLGLLAGIGALAIRAWGRSLPPVPSSARWPASAPAERWAAWSEPSSGWGSRIRSQTLRRTCQERRRAPVRALRHAG